MTDEELNKLVAWLEVQFNKIEERFRANDDRFDSLRREMYERIDSLRSEMVERFQSASDRIVATERRAASHADSHELLRDTFYRLSAELGAARQDIGRVDTRLDNVERDLYEVTARINTLGDDMRQRFRVLTERVA